MLRLPRLSSAKLTLSVPNFGTYERISSPRPGRSILITSAPASASIRVASGPGRSVLKSSTRMPASGLPLVTADFRRDERLRFLRRLRTPLFGARALRAGA